MENKTIERNEIKLVGKSHFGSLKGEGWSEANSIGQTWQRFVEFKQANENLIESKKVNKDETYEVHAWNDEEFESKGCFKLFVGVEVNDFEGIPLDLDRLVLPASKYVILTRKGKEIFKTQTDNILPRKENPRNKSGNYMWEIQLYTDSFKGMDKIEESELDFYVPIKS